MIPLTVEHIVPPPLKRVGTKIGDTPSQRRRSNSALRPAPLI